LLQCNIVLLVAVLVAPASTVVTHDGLTAPENIATMSALLKVCDKEQLWQ
jgi:tellurite resistance protein